MNAQDTKSLPYRIGVQAYIFNDKDELLIVCSSGKERFWKIPSGGVERGETLETTIKREMKEELNVEIDVLKKLDFKNKFDWPSDVVAEQGFRYRGQEQTIFIVMIKENQSINVDKTELQDYVWVKFSSIREYMKLENQQEMAERVIKEYNKIKK